ncbi:MAG: MFS transporter [Burkholderiales bacterium]|nr:MFS transporter [Burkholderiales bacterium]
MRLSSTGIKASLQYILGLPPAIRALAVAVFVNRVGGAARTFFALYLHEARGLPLTGVGFMLALFGAGNVAGGFLVGVLSDYWPTRRLIVVTLGGSGLSLLLLAIAQPTWLLGLLMLLGGLLDGGFRPMLQRLVMEAVPDAQRTRAQSVVRSSINLGVAFAGLIGAWLATRGYLWVFVADGCGGILAAAWLASRLQGFVPIPRPIKAGAATPDRSPYTDLPFLMLLGSALILAIIYDQFYSTFGAYIREAYQLSGSWVGYMYSLNGLIVGFCQIPITALTDRFGYRANAATGAAMIAAGFAMLPFGHGPLYLCISTAVWTIGELLLMPQQFALVTQRAETGRSGHYIGLYAAIWGGGRGLLAPLVGTQLYAHFGGNGLWYCVGLAGALAVFIQQRAVRALLDTPRESLPAMA